MEFFDAHNHLQDERLAAQLPQIIATARAAGVRKMVVNGTNEHDWARVAELADMYPDIITPAFGLHPWFAGKQSPCWQKTLCTFLEKFPTAPIGEVGLDRWIPDHDMVAQTAILHEQIALAVALRRPLILHCLKAFGALENLLRTVTPLPRGFLLHSYGGSLEQMKNLAALGGWFSCSGYFFHDRNASRQHVFELMPLDRLLIETDAPDMLGPPDCARHTLSGNTEKLLNHPANLPQIYGAVAALRKIPISEFTHKIAENFISFFD